MKKLLALIPILLTATTGLAMPFGVFQGNKLIGDFNHDCIVDMSDLYMLLDYVPATRAWGEPYYSGWADITKDGIINIFDLYYAAINYGKTCEHANRLG